MAESYILEKEQSYLLKLTCKVTETRGKKSFQDLTSSYDENPISRV